jgi:hypothetical protein
VRKNAKSVNLKWSLAGGRSTSCSRRDRPPAPDHLYLRINEYMLSVVLTGYSPCAASGNGSAWRAYAPASMVAKAARPAGVIVNNRSCELGECTAM